MKQINALHLYINKIMYTANENKEVYIVTYHNDTDLCIIEYIGYHNR